MKSLTEWLNTVGSTHNKVIDMGLERTHAVAEKMQLLHWDATIITVAGTNGKGSTVSLLEKIYGEAGFQVGALTSPDLMRYNERVKINGEEASDQMLCQAFAEVEKARGSITLTFFEFNVLVALYLFKQKTLDIILLEVGMGGRLDATNVIDPNLAIITSIGLDHMEFLGDNREAIAREKAGILRNNIPAVIADLNPPKSLQQIITEKQVKAKFILRDFNFADNNNSWSWQSSDTKHETLPKPALLLQNCASALMAIELLQADLPVLTAAIRTALQQISLPGRFEKIELAGKTVIFDVAHNVDSCRALKMNCQQHLSTQNISAVFSILKNKDISGCLEAVKDQFNEWHIAPLEHERGCDAMTLESHFKKANIKNYKLHNNIEAAFKQALQSNANTIVVFGSFVTVAKVKASRAY